MLGKALWSISSFGTVEANSLEVPQDGDHRVRSRGRLPSSSVRAQCGQVHSQYRWSSSADSDSRRMFLSCGLIYYFRYLKIEYVP